MPDFIALNQPAPAWMASAFGGASTGGVILLAQNLILLRIEDMSAKDIRSLKGPADVGVYRGRHALLINLRTRTISFDLWWSPLIARRNGETPAQADEEVRPMFSIIALDGRDVVRNIRGATLSPEVNIAIARAMSELLEETGSERDIQIEVEAISALYPGRLPDSLFHATCRLGD